jgi:hypothetical protein
LNYRLFHLAGKLRTDRVDLRLRILLCVVDARAQPELHDDRRHPFGGGRRNVPHARDGVERLFNALGYFALHGFRRCAGVQRLHGQNGDLHIRKLIDRELPVREDSQRDQ